MLPIDDLEGKNWLRGGEDPDPDPRENAKGGWFLAPIAVNVKIFFTPVDRPRSRSACQVDLGGSHHNATAEEPVRQIEARHKAIGSAYKYKGPQDKQRRRDPNLTW